MNRGVDRVPTGGGGIAYPWQNLAGLSVIDLPTPSPNPYAIDLWLTASSAADVSARTSQDGVAFDSGASDYAPANHQISASNAGAPATSFTASGNSIVLLGSVTIQYFVGRFIFVPSVGSLSGHMALMFSGTTNRIIIAEWLRAGGTIPQAVRFFTAGVWTSGGIRIEALA